jgi:hypothetical protein
MDRYRQFATHVQGGVFDSARRMVKAQEEALDAVEGYQHTLTTEARWPWDGVKAGYDLVKQLAGIQADLALEWSGAFERAAQQSARKTAKSAA